MKQIIPAVFRAVLAIAFAIVMVNVFSDGFLHPDKGESDIAFWVSRIIVFQLCFCFFFYMMANAVLGFMRKPIRFRFLYAINAIIMTAMGIYVIAHNRFDEYTLIDKALFLSPFALMLYFIIADFIALFINRGKRVAPGNTGMF